MPNKFEVTDPRGYQITCPDWAWEHIIGDRPWMDTEDWVQDIQRTVEKPTMGIYQDADFDARIVYYAFRLKGKERYVKVVVEITGEKVGQIITAYQVKTPKAGEKLIWLTSKT